MTRVQVFMGKLYKLLLILSLINFHAANELMRPKLTHARIIRKFGNAAARGASKDWHVQVDNHDQR